MRSSNSSVRSAGIILLRRLGGWARDYIQPHQDAPFVGQVANDFAERERQFLDKRRGNDNLIWLDEFRVLVNIDDFEIVAAVQPFIAEGTNVLNGAGGFGSGA